MWLDKAVDLMKSIREQAPVDRPTSTAKRLLEAHQSVIRKIAYKGKWEKI